jgi:hypothetical protein
LQAEEAASIGTVLLGDDWAAHDSMALPVWLAIYSLLLRIQAVTGEHARLGAKRVIFPKSHIIQIRHKGPEGPEAFIPRLHQPYRPPA